VRGRNDSIEGSLKDFKKRTWTPANQAMVFFMDMKAFRSFSAEL
jgi:hypothetical protein